MSVTSISGLKVWMQKQIPAGSPNPRVDVTVSDMTTTGELTFDSTVQDVSEGDILTFETTGFDKLDKKILVAGVVDKSSPAAATVNILGAGRLNLSGTFNATTAEVKVLPKAELVQLCLSTLTQSAGSTNTIDVSTFCNPGAALPGNPTAGSVTFGGYTDITDAGYLALLDAQDDKANRLFKIDIPNQGSITAEVAVGNVTWDFPLEGSSSYSFDATMAIPMRHVF